MQMAKDHPGNVKPLPRKHLLERRYELMCLGGMALRESYCDHPAELPRLW